MKRKIVRWLVSLLTDDEYWIVRKKRVLEIAKMANNHPGMKIVVISLLRLEGMEFKPALKIYQEWNNQNVKD